MEPTRASGSSKSHRQLVNRGIGEPLIPLAPSVLGTFSPRGGEKQEAKTLSHHILPNNPICACGLWNDSLESFGRGP